MLLSNTEGGNAFLFMNGSRQDTLHEFRVGDPHCQIGLLTLGFLQVDQEGTVKDEAPWAGSVVGLSV